MKLVARALGLLVSAMISGQAVAEDGVTDSTILLGQTVGLTGTVAGPVKEVNEGALAYFNEINKNGGIHGRKIELRTLDDKFDPGTASANAEKLIKGDRVFALFQGRGTPHTQAVSKILAENRVPLVGPGTGATALHEPVNPWIFNVRAKYRTEITRGIEHLATLNIKSIALLHVDDAFGEDGLIGFKEAMASRNVAPAAIVKFARVDPNYTAAAAEVIKAQPQALLLISSAKNTVEAIKAIRAAGSQMMIMTLSNNTSDSFVKALGSAGNGVIISQVTPAPDLVTSKLGQEFQRVARANKITVSYAAMEGFINAKVMAEGLQRAGRNLTRDGLVRALESLRKVDLGGTLINYSPTDHTGSEYVELTMIGKNGRYVR